MPLQEVSCAGDRDHDPGPRVAFVARVADELLDRLGAGACELTEQLPTTTEQRTQQAWDREHDMAVRDGQEHMIWLGADVELASSPGGAAKAAP